MKRWSKREVGVKLNEMQSSIYLLINGQVGLIKWKGQRENIGCIWFWWLNLQGFKRCYIIIQITMV